MEQYFKKWIIFVGFIVLTLFCLATTGSYSDTTIPKLRQRPLPERYNECHLCHIKKNQQYIRKKKTLTREHGGILLQHGREEISCNSCHDINNHNYLRASTSLKASFENPSPVCQRCHAEKYRDWTKGIHGKRLGGWYKPQEQFNCIDCHNHHSVRFKPLLAKSPPQRPRFSITKKHEKETDMPEH